MKKYWASEVDPVEVIKRAEGYISDWQINALSGNSAISALWLRNTISYYSAILNSDNWQTALSFKGAQGELVKMTIPRARKLIRQVLSLSTQQRLDFQAVSMSQDLESLNAARISQALASQIVEAQNLQSKGESAFEKSLFLGNGAVMTTWRTDKGLPFATGENDQLVYSGDVEFRDLNIYDMVFDTTKQQWSDQDWVIVRTLHNRWDLIAQFPDMEDRILKLPPVKDGTTNYWWFSLTSVPQEDDIYVYEFYHKATPAIPTGRMTMFGDQYTVFHDGENLYDCLPVDMIVPEPIHGTAFGYPLLSDILPAQEMLDHCYSAIATNQSATAVQMFTAARNADIAASDIQGMSFLLYDPQQVPGGGKPEGLNLNATSADTYKFADMVEAQMMKLVSLNNALIGEPNPGVTAGNAIATLTSNALRFMDAYTKQYTMMLEGVMTKAIMCYQKFATEDRIVNYVGKNNKQKAYKFKGADISTIKRMKLKASNPMLQTTGGRMDIAEKLLSNGLIKQPQKYLSLIDGAPLDSIYEDERSENDLVQEERDMMLEGKTPTILLTQDHAAHIRCHAADLNDQLLLQNHDAVGLYLKHIEEHLQLSKTADPYLTAILRTGQAPQMPPPPPPSAQGPGQAEANPDSAMSVASPAEPAKPMNVQSQ